MPAESLLEIVQSLNPLEQDAVRAFVRYLKEREAIETTPRPSSILLAADEFMREHPEILRRLGQ